MQSDENGDKFRKLINEQQKIGIGVYDGLSTFLATKHNFDFVWVGSFAVSATHGLPDVGLLESSDMLNTLRIVARSTNLPIVVDIEIGYGDALKVLHVVRSMLALRISGICIEDYSGSKRSSLYSGYSRQLASIAEQAARLRACRIAIDEQRVRCAVVARTEALVAGMGVDEALERAHAYVAAGADAILVQSSDDSASEILEFCAAWNRKTALFLVPTCYPQVSRSKLFAAGASHLIFANHAARAANLMIDTVFAHLKDADSSAVVESMISSSSDVSSLVGESAIRNLESTLLGSN
jgi:phosphoenolpyruvate phosphomutase